MPPALVTFIARRLAVALSALCAVSAPPVAPGSPLQELEEAFIALYEEKAQAVVRVKVATKTEGGASGESVALTVFSGFFIDDQGTVLTNALPDEEITRLWIEKDGQSYLAEAMASDERSNVGLIRTVNLPDSFGTIELQATSPEPPVGSIAFAVTSPLDFDPSPAWGLVSGRESQFAEITFPFTYTRVGIPIGPAEGGSPFFDAQGRLLGIAVAALPDVNSAYLVPAQPLGRIVDGLSTQGGVRYGTLRMSYEELIGPGEGGLFVSIKSIEPGSPAERGGLRPGDRLVSVSDEPVRSIDELRDTLFFSEAGVFLPVVIERDGRLIEFALMLESLPDGKNG